MAEKKDTSFKFRIDEESPDTELRQPRRAVPEQKKWPTAMVVFTILIPAVLAVLFALAYLDLRKRVTLNQDTGTRSVQSLSQDVETKLSDITTKVEDLESAYAKSNAAVEKTLSSLKFRLHKTDYRVKQVNDSMVTQKEHAAMLSQLEKLSTQLQSMDDAFNQRMADLTGSVKSSRIDLTQVKTDLEAKLDQPALDQQLSGERKKWQRQIQVFEKDVNSQLKRIQQAIARMEKSIKAIETKRAVTPSPPSQPPPPDQQSGTPSPSNQDTIIEKDL